jgi:hypothetical protein
MWNSLDLSCLLCAVCKSVFTDCRDISILNYITCEIVWIYCLLCAVCKSIFTDCRDISTLYYITCEIVWIYSCLLCLLYVNKISLYWLQIYTQPRTQGITFAQGVSVSEGNNLGTRLRYTWLWVRDWKIYTMRHI